MDLNVHLFPNHQIQLGSLLAQQVDAAIVANPPADQRVRSVQIARERVYAVFGAADRLETDYFEGRHRINGQRAYDFLAEHLSAVL